MSAAPTPVVRHPDDIGIEEWDDKRHGEVRWRTLISSDRTPSCDLVCGLAYFDAGQTLALHRHEQSEIVHVLEGSGTATFESESAPMKPGTTIFVGKNAPHQWTAGKDGMVLLFTVAASSFADIRYRFDP